MGSDTVDFYGGRSYNFSETKVRIKAIHMCQVAPPWSHYKFERLILLLLYISNTPLSNKSAGAGSAG